MVASLGGRKFNGEGNMNKCYAVLSAVLAPLLSACAGATPQQSVETVDLKSKEPVCVRECSTTYSACIQRAGITDNRLVANDILRACGGALKICADTCPPIK